MRAINDATIAVYAGQDFASDEFLVAFRANNGGHRGVVTASGYIEYQPATEENARPTLRLLLGEAVALADALVRHGLVRVADDVTPLKAHLSDAMQVRDRLLVVVEKVKDRP